MILFFSHRFSNLLLSSIPHINLFLLIHSFVFLKHNLTQFRRVFPPLFFSLKPPLTLFPHEGLFLECAFSPGFTPFFLQNQGTALDFSPDTSNGLPFHPCGCPTPKSAAFWVSGAPPYSIISPIRPPSLPGGVEQAPLHFGSGSLGLKDFFFFFFFSLLSCFLSAFLRTR